MDEEELMYKRLMEKRRFLVHKGMQFSDAFINCEEMGEIIKYLKSNYAVGITMMVDILTNIATNTLADVFIRSLPPKAHKEKELIDKFLKKLYTKEFIKHVQSVVDRNMEAIACENLNTTTKH